MPRGPKVEKRPADVIGNAVRVMQIATGEREEEYAIKDAGKAAGGAKGGALRSSRLTPEQRAEAARLAAQARWRRKTD